MAKYIRTFGVGKPIQMTDTILGVDIGGTGMKAAPVDVASGHFQKERIRTKPKNFMPQLNDPSCFCNFEG